MKLLTLDEIERRAEGRLPGYWQVASDGDYSGGGINVDAGMRGYVCLVDGSAECPSENSRANANLIADAPRLLEIAQEQRSEIARLKGALAQADAALRSVP